jgi:hypothetical protein
MDRPSTPLVSPADMQTVRRVDRRDFLKQCGFMGLLAGAATLSACAGGQQDEQPAEKPSGAFFADGTNFAD